MAEEVLGVEPLLTTDRRPQYFGELSALYAKLGGQGMKE